MKQKATRSVLEDMGLTTWRITKTRNQVVVLLWLACWRLNRKNPFRAYEALKQQGENTAVGEA